MRSTPMDTYAVRAWEGMKMVGGRTWREEINKEFYFLYSRGYTLSGVSVRDHEAEAVFSSRHREITIRWDSTNRLSVEISRSRTFWSRLLKRTARINVFDWARRQHPGTKLPVLASDKDFHWILGQYAEYLREHLLEVIDGNAWVEG
jgi:hypothetical protein